MLLAEVQPPRSARSRLSTREGAHLWPTSGSGRVAGRRTLKQLLRLKLHLHRGRYVLGCVRLNHRKQPSLVLHPRAEADVGTQPVITAHTHVRQGASPRDELPADFLMPIVKL